MKLARALCASALLLLAGDAGAVSIKAARAKLAILDLKLDEAADVLKDDDDDPEIAIERGRLGLYRGDCDAAVAALERPDLEGDEEAAYLFATAKGCARGSAATVTLRDAERGVEVRFQDDADSALFPLIADAAVRIRETLTTELGTRLPDPVRIDLLRDQFTLAAMTGLPEEAARTTGTVAVAKWGRVMMISPRAASHGYPWLDTLAHEMTHLVVSQASRDRAPLWLQEGVAKRMETRWRTATPFDGYPPSDDVAAIGMERGLGVSLTGIGPSIAMLPTPEQARVAFAQVSSFVDYWVAEVGPQGLPKLLGAMRDSTEVDATEAIQQVSGKSMADWEKSWQQYLARKPHALPPEIAPGGTATGGFREVARRRRLGQLLLEHGHTAQAERQLTAAVDLLASDATVRCHLADAKLALGYPIAAGELVARPSEIRMPTGRWWSLHDAFGPLGASAAIDPFARWRAIGQDPFEPAVACHELDGGEQPDDPIQRAICEMALSAPR